MGVHTQIFSFFILFLFGFLAVSYACDCTPPKPSPHPFKPPKHPVKPPKPPAVKPSKPPAVKPPTPKPPTKPPTLPTPTPPIVTPPTPTPPVVKPPAPTPPASPIVTPPTQPSETPCPPPPSPPTTPSVPPTPKPETCPIDTLKLGACVDVLRGLIHIGLGKSHAKKECCPVLGGLVDLDAAVCLCTTIKTKLLNIKLILPIALELLLDCGKTPPKGFKCAT